MKKKSLRSRAASALKSFVFDSGNPDHWSSGGGANWLKMPDGNLNTGRVNVWASSLVVACLAWGARNLRQAQITLLKETAPKKYEQIASHPALDLLKRPNPHYSAKALFIGAYLSYQLDGNGYIIKVKNARGFGLPVELYYAPHWCMRPVYTPGSSTWIDYYEYTFEGKLWRFAPEDVIHIKQGVDPFNPRLGYAPLKSVLLEIFTDEEAAKFTACLLKNMAVPGLIISPDGGAGTQVSIQPEQAKNLIEKFKRRFGGKNRGEPFVSTGPIKVQTVGFTPDELNLESVRKIPADRVVGVLGIPGAVVGLGSGNEAATYNNLRSYQRQAFEQHLVPVWDDFAEELTDQLLRDYDDDPALFFDFDTSEVAALREDEDAIHKRAKEALDAGGITVQQYQSMLGLPVDPLANYYLRISSKAPVTPEGAAEQASLGLFSAFFTTQERLGDGQGAPGAQTPQQLAQKALAAIMAAQMKRLPPSPAERTVAAGGAFKSLEDDVEQTQSEAAPLFAEALRAAFVGMAADVPAEVAAVGALTDAAKAAEIIGTRVVGRRVELFTTAFGEMHSRIEEEAKAHVRRGLQTEAVNNDASQAGIAGNNAARVAAYTSDLKQQTVTAVREAILAMEEGATHEQIVKRISQHVSGRQMYPGVFDQARKAALVNGATEAAADAAGEEAAILHRAQLIAETETRTCANYDLIETLGAAGVEKLLVHDGADCGWEYHDQDKKADGMIVTLAQARRHPLSHPRCRRRFTPLTDGGQPARA
ncbi:MAG TPA: phage portal protein [Pyrinomonadaceae bacterium]|jgi:HK97 family phage portal protein|nr:phage portal protein [Pyrinomonadaceae bacterium]